MNFCLMRTTTQTVIITPVGMKWVQRRAATVSTETLVRPIFWDLSVDRCIKLRFHSMRTFCQTRKSLLWRHLGSKSPQQCGPPHSKQMRTRVCLLYPFMSPTMILIRSFFFYYFYFWVVFQSGFLNLRICPQHHWFEGVVYSDAMSLHVWSWCHDLPSLVVNWSSHETVLVSGLYVSCLKDKNG